MQKSGKLTAPGAALLDAEVQVESFRQVREA
ncbi:manganese transporter, partial [Xanthomonas hyacinthi DSM 19077]